MSQPLTCQKNLFQLDEDCIFLNGAYMSPQLKSVESAGLHAVRYKNTPNRFTTDDFFNPVEDVKQAFAQLVNINDAQRIAIVPSVSYGMATVAKNVNITAGRT